MPLEFQPNPLSLVMAILVAWRLAAFLVQDYGPWRLAVRIRSLVDIDHDDDGDPISWPDTFPGSLFKCVGCMSFWTAGPVYVILLTAPEALVPAAIWTGATILQRTVDT